MGKTYKAQGNSETKKLAGLLKSKPIKEINLLSLVKRGGYAERVASELQKQKKTRRSQVRKLFSEFKQIFDLVGKDLKNKGDRLDVINSEAGMKLCMLYPIIAYQKERDIISEDFADLMSSLIDNLNNEPTKENFEQAKNFLTALVAYMRKEA